MPTPTEIIAENYIAYELYSNTVAIGAGVKAQYVEFYAGTRATITNAGTIKYRAWLDDGGSIVNSGYVSEIRAEAGTATITNSGVIDSYINLEAGGAITNTGTISADVTLANGGAVSNGDATHKTALMADIGTTGSVAETVVNFGTISKYVDLSASGDITNGSTADTGAFIGTASTDGEGSIANFGTIGGGVALDGGADFTNGTSGDFKARSGEVTANLVATVSNFGTVAGGFTGIELVSGGVITNGGASDLHGYIGGDSGIEVGSGAGTVTNFGTILGKGDFAYASGVQLYEGGKVTNGSATDLTALIAGPDGVRVNNGAATIMNFGTIRGTGLPDDYTGVYVQGGGVITNGGTADTGALISGYDGLHALTKTATVLNFGTIMGTASAGAYLTVGGKITNGADDDAVALIEGYEGVLVTVAAGEVSNYGAIKASGKSTAAIAFTAGGGITNAASGTIQGYDGVRATADAATVSNLGTVTGSGTGTLSGGVYLDAGGKVTNGSADDSGALLTGYYGVIAKGAAATIENYGTIGSTRTTFTLTPAGVYLTVGGDVTNGDEADTTALIQAASGVKARNAVATITNYGTISGTGNTITAGVSTAQGGDVTNGAAGDGEALIQGYDGVASGTVGKTTVSNFGAIKSTSKGAGTLNAAGIYLAGGGLITNQGDGETYGSIEGYSGIVLRYAAATVTNHGTITGTGTGKTSGGIYATAGADVTNGGATDSGAVITGYFGVFAKTESATVANFGTIQTSSPALTIHTAAIYLAGGGSITNGVASDTTAQLRAANGVFANDHPATVENYGTITGTGDDVTAGVFLASGGVVSNLEGKSGSALIQGYNGVESGTTGTVSVNNEGTIKGDGAGTISAAGVYLAGGGAIVNGADGASTGLIEGYRGVLARLASATVTNFETIIGMGTGKLSAGVYFAAGGNLTNGGAYAAGARVTGYDGVKSLKATLTVTNYGVITGTGAGKSAGGVYLTGGGSITNLAGQETAGVIQGYDGVLATTMAATVNNAGTIQGAGAAGVSAGVYLALGGAVTNASGFTAIVSGYSGVLAKSGAVTVTNQDTIIGSGKAKSAGVYLEHGGTVTNGASTHPSGLIQGYDGVHAKTVAAMVGNYGTITGKGAGKSSAGIFLTAGGTIDNGSFTAGAALIDGYTGITSEGAVAVAVFNEGTIKGVGVGTIIAAGVYLSGGGTVANVGGLIQGYRGVLAKSKTATVTNLETITGTGTGKAAAGVYFMAGGSLDNGNADSYSGQVSGYDGVHATAVAATVTNYGMVTGTGAGKLAAGVYLTGGGLVTNGAAPDTAGLIQGYTGVLATTKAATVSNAGTIKGSGKAGESAGVYLGLGGAVTNATRNGEAAIISGYSGVFAKYGPVKVTNQDTITGSGKATQSAGVYLFQGGTVINGVYGSAGGLVQGYDGIHAVGGAATVTTYGTVSATGTTSYAAGIRLDDGGSISNGGLHDYAATVVGYNGVRVTGLTSINNVGTIRGTGRFSAGVNASDGAVIFNFELIQGYNGVDAGGRSTLTLTNSGTITGAATGKLAAGVDLAGGGTVNNRYAGIISGYDGVSALLAAATVSNLGTILGKGLRSGAAGVRLGTGGAVTNGSATNTSALISGYYGVNAAGAAATIVNLATIIGTGTLTSAGVELAAGGTITNGGATNTKALIQGDNGVMAVGATISNFATIMAPASAGVRVQSGGGKITNGGATNTSALIEGHYGVRVSAGFETISNFGTIEGTPGFANTVGIYLQGGGTITNGGSSNKTAQILGYNDGLVAKTMAATITNFGTIRESGVQAGTAGVNLAVGGKVTNGGSANTTAVIHGVDGIEGGFGVLTVSNFGTVEGEGTLITSAGVYVRGGGAVTNGSGADTGALISGNTGVLAKITPVTIANFGSIVGTGAEERTAGVYLAGGGDVTNGGAKGVYGLIQGYNGVFSRIQAVTLTNLGTITGVGAGTASAGAYITAGGSVDNGSGSLIQGKMGVLAKSKAVTVTNFGTIRGGVYLLAGGSLTNGAGGFVTGDAGVEVTGTGTVTNFGTIDGAGGDSVQFKSATSTLVVEAGSTFVGAVAGDGGTLDLASGSGVISNLTSGGNLTVSGSMPSATFDDFATIDFAAGSAFTVTGTDNLAKGKTLADTGSLTVTGKLIVSGTVSGAGTLTLSGNATTLDAGASLTVARVVVSGAAATVNVDTALTDAKVWDQTSGKITVATGDTLSFSGAGNSFAGALAGSGTVAFIGGSDSLAGVTISAKNVSRAGAAVTMSGTTSNTGTITVTTGSLTVQGALTGAGAIHIGGGAADFTSTTAALTENVTFTGAAGVLELADSRAYTGTIAGFSKTGTTSLDLADIAFASGTTKASFSGTATSGVLTVTDGTHTARIKLSGNYTASTFTVASDGHGGTTVTDPTGTAATGPSPALSLVAAMAGFGGGGGSGASQGVDTRPPPSLGLAAPGAGMGAI